MIICSIKDFVIAFATGAVTSTVAIVTIGLYYYSASRLKKVKL